MRRVLPLLGLLLIVLAVPPIGNRWDPDRVYGEYDREFRAHLARAALIVGKETIQVERLSGRFTVPQKLTVRGTPYEIGLTIGHVGRQARAHLPMVTEANRALNQKVIDLYRRVYPQYLEVIRGVAAAYQQPAGQVDLRVFERDFTAPLWCDLLNYEKFYKATDFKTRGDRAEKHHCSAASYFSNGRQLVGRNFDHASDRPHYFATVEMAGTYKVMGNTIYDITGEVDDGMNERGLALCVASNDDGKYASREPYPREPAVVMWHMMQIVLQTCATVDEALALLRAVRVWLPEEGNHWLLADATGKAVVVEWAPGDHKLVVCDKQGPYELMTNTALQEGEDYLVENCRRYRKARPLLEDGVHTTAEMFEVMKAMRITAGPGRTLWTSVMDLNARTFEVRYFKEFDRRYEFGFPPRGGPASP
jgi:predicted choloylglycine hydrolase